MASSSQTQTAVLEKLETKCLHCELDHGGKVSCLVEMNKNKDDHKLRCYEAVRSKNEGKIMSAIRDWEKQMGFETPIRWLDAIAIVLFHIICTVGTVELFQKHSPKLQTYLFTYLVGQMAGFGVTGGAHRYWTHRSFKANTPLQIILLICYSIAGENDLFQWVRDHRVHHKFSEKSADPHNANRGFFFAHVGWLMMKKHPDVLREGSKIDMSDIREDPLVRFHTKYFAVFKTLLCFVLPVVIPVMCWDETWTVALLSQALRYMLTLNCTWSVNSFAHLWGNKPYDRHIMPVQNLCVSIAAMGEGWHNYHHTFPWDYKAAELPYPFNATANIIDMFAKIGWAYDLKTASPTLIQTVSQKRGDPLFNKAHYH